jgi:hypothetical protein
MKGETTMDKVRKVTGSIKLDINSGGLETNYGPYANTLLTGKSFLTSGKVTPSVDYVQNPTFDVNVLSNQEFMKGFTSPCTKDLLAYYWEQGWPPEFLLYLFVHNVDVKLDDGTMRHYENYPDTRDKSLKKLEEFGSWLRALSGKRQDLFARTSQQDLAWTGPRRATSTLWSRPRRRASPLLKERRKRRDRRQEGCH